MTGILERQTHPELGTWRRLIEKAITAMEIVERDTGLPQLIRIGGGTVLSALWGHRYSKDVDLFTRDPQVLGFLRPWLSQDVCAVLGPDFTEGPNSIKFRIEAGSIDIFAAGDILTDSSPTVETYLGRKVEIEDPAEIVAKKLHYRGDRGTVCDYVDLMRGMDEIPNLAQRLSAPLGGRAVHVAEVLRQMPQDRFRRDLAAIRFLGEPPDPFELRERALKAMEAFQGPRTRSGTPSAPPDSEINGDALRVHADAVDAPEGGNGNKHRSVVAEKVSTLERRPPISTLGSETRCVTLAQVQANDFAPGPGREILNLALGEPNRPRACEWSNQVTTAVRCGAATPLSHLNTCGA